MKKCETLTKFWIKMFSKMDKSAITNFDTIDSKYFFFLQSRSDFQAKASLRAIEPLQKKTHNPKTYASFNKSFIQNVKWIDKFARVNFFRPTWSLIHI